MHPFAIELNDRAVSFAREGRIVSAAPSAVWDGSTGELPGANAWQALRRHPTATSTRHLGALLGQSSASDRSVALVVAELVRRLGEQAPTPAERVWIVSPARVSEQGLSAMLAIAHKLSLPVDGFVDSAVASVAASGIEGHAIVLELGLHHAAATSIDRDGPQVRRRRTVATDRGGLMALYQGWLELVSTTMVKQTRFDPLHDALTEQRLFDSLASWAREAEREGSVRAILAKDTQSFDVALTRDQFAQANRAVHREIARLLHELRPAGAPVTLVVPSTIVEFPGVRDELEDFVDCQLVSLPDGFAAAAVSRLDLPGRSLQDPVRLLRRLPSQEQFDYEDVTRGSLGSLRARAGSPSHLLLEGQVYALGAEPLVLGRAPVGSRTICVPEGIAGVSRRHCTLVAQAGEVILLDHSTFGTFVNGERVAERVRVRAGDRLRLGDPGIEIALLAVNDAPNGAH